MVSGGSSFTATPAKKKEPPHSIDSRTSSTPSRPSILAAVRVIDELGAKKVYAGNS